MRSSPRERRYGSPFCKWMNRVGLRFDSLADDFSDFITSFHFDMLRQRVGRIARFRDGRYAL